MIDLLCLLLFLKVKIVLINLLLKCKISAIWLVETARIFLIFLIATEQISMECGTQEARWDILNISGYTNLKHTWYMRKYRVKQCLIVLKLDCVSINKILVVKFVTVRVSYNLNLMQSLSTQWNQELIKYVFSKVIKCLEQNIRKQIDCKRPSNTKQMNWVQNTRIKRRKYKAVKCIEI